jgi:hypothetical protein
MDRSLNELIDINASGLVLMACNCHQIWDPEQISVHKKWVIDKIIDQMERDKVGVEALSRILDEKISLLNQELEKISGSPTAEDIPPEAVDQQEQAEPKPKAPKTDSGYKPKSKDMPTKLAQERKPVRKLILEDCVQLGLITKKRAEYVVTQMAGKQPADAEKEVVVELRKNLHKQVRNFIRKDKNGPWSSPKAQEELRLEIIQMPTVRSMIYLTKEIFKDREEWKDRSHGSITGRIFGGRLTVDKSK